MTDTTINEKIFKILEDNSCYVKDSDCSIDFDDTHETANELEILFLQSQIDLLNDVKGDFRGFAWQKCTDKISELTNKLKELNN